MVALVEAHVEPFHFQGFVQNQNVAHWELFGDAQKLLTAMEMIHWRHHEFLIENIVTSRRIVDVLAISGHLFVEHLDQEKINHLIKIDHKGAILLHWNHCQIDKFWKVFVKHLFLVGQVPTLEYIFELQEGPFVVQINFCHSTDKVIDHLVESKLNSELAQIFVNFGLLFVARIVCRHRPGVSFWSRFSDPWSVVSFCTQMP
jgi:hypothetical protein